MYDLESVLHDTESKRFEVKDLDTANWAVSKMTKANQRIAQYQALATEYHRKIDAWLADISKEDKDTIEFFEAELRPFVSREIASHKAKSVKLMGGIAGYRSGTDTVEIEDEQKALQYCRAFAPELIRVTESIDKGDAKKRLQKGEVIEGLRLVPGIERFYVKTEAE
jgi:phage host-nuclease inhibitor protein Gam